MLLLPFQKLSFPLGVPPHCRGAGPLPSHGAGGVLPLPGVQGEGDGGPDVEGEGESNPLGDQRLADVQALGGHDGVSSTHCCHFVLLLK